MKIEDVKFYRVVCVFFVFVIIMLAYFNIKSFEKAKFNKVNDKSIVSTSSNTITEFGYSEALDMLTKVPNLNIINFNNSTDNKRLLKVELEYMGDNDNFIKIISDFKKENNYFNIDNIKEENDSTNNKSIKFNLFLIINR